MKLLIYSFVTSFLVAFFFIPVIINFFNRKKILDAPGGRKIHKTFTPSMGGIAIFAGLALSVVLWMPSEDLEKFKYLYGGLTIIFLTGVRDDLVPLRPLYKLVGQIVAASMVVGLSPIQFSSLYGLFGIHEIPEAIGIILSVFTIIVITNSFNLIDGLDGLAGSISIIVLTSFGLWFFMLGNILISVLIFGMIGAIVAFLNFNWQPSKIFMGDTGALLIGFFLSVLTIYFIDFNYHLDPSIKYRFRGTIGTAVAILIVPLFDTSRVFVSRALKGRSPFEPDKTHIHHLIMRLGFEHAGATTIMACINIGFVLLALVLRNLPDYVVLPAVLGVALGLSYLLDKIIRKKFRLKRIKRNSSRSSGPSEA